VESLKLNQAQAMPHMERFKIYKDEKMQIFSMARIKEHFPILFNYDLNDKVETEFGFNEFAQVWQSKLAGLNTLVMQTFVSVRLGSLVLKRMLSVLIEQYSSVYRELEERNLRVNMSITPDDLLMATQKFSSM